MKIKIITHGMDAMRNDFRALAESAVYDHASESLKDALRTGFEGTQAAVPVGDGDYRRPAGSLRDSGRFSSDWDGAEWSGEVAYGTEDDIVPYAAWVRYKNLRKVGEDYLGDPMDAATPLFDQAVDQPWRDVFGE